MNERLAKARTAALADLAKNPGTTSPKWRIIHTDSESPTGLAPVCTGDRSDNLHMIADYPGGPVRDEEGVYDCCPWPQIETYSPVWAAYLVELLTSDGEKASATPAPTATPNFFQPGHTYSSHNTWTFKVTTVAEDPNGDRAALGFIHGTTYGGDIYDGVWDPHGETSFDGWTDITTTGEDGHS